MKKAALTAALGLLLAGAASAGETGIINQSGPYEATMKFYLHPAHGFPRSSEPTAPTALADENANATPSARTPGQPATMVAARSRRDRVKTQGSTDLRLDP
ncbi:MAG TPA: hypothetical protein VMN79_05335 [Casimicrobiaceae bacterium]|nr:hypothetical protein [Casimicrobiaceae bacterium]